MKQGEGPENRPVGIYGGVAEEVGGAHQIHFQRSSWQRISLGSGTTFIHIFFRLMAIRLPASVSSSSSSKRPFTGQDRKPSIVTTKGFGGDCSQELANWRPFNYQSNRSTPTGEHGAKQDY